MALEAAFFLPHPPLIFNEIGRGREEGISKTIDSFNKVAVEISSIKPETIIIISPHTTIYADYFHISPGKKAYGDFSDFYAKELKAEVSYDKELADEISKHAGIFDLAAGTEGEKNPKLDHASLIPILFIKKYLDDLNVIRIGFSGLSNSDHYRFGTAVANACSALERKVVLIASGDLSHKLLGEGPYGFNPAGPKFDKKMTDIMVSSNFLDLLETDSDLAEEAGECGFRSFLILAGALDGYNVESTLLSYEGPFGVGYAISSFFPKEKSDERKFLTPYFTRRDERLSEIKANEDAFVSLARASVEHFINKNKALKLPSNLPSELLETKAGVFVTLKKEGNLRGCIGTIFPTKNSVAEEIINNAISAATHDYRFDRVEPEELNLLEYSVDVLGAPEPVNSTEDLDPERFGVIVSIGNRRGLLLPALSGVDTVEKQIKIALQKAGIRESEDYSIERFEVVRHT